MEDTNKKIWCWLAFIIFLLFAFYCIKTPISHYPYGATEEEIRNGDIY